MLGRLAELVNCHRGADAEVGGFGCDAAVDEVGVIDEFAFDAGIDDFDGDV